MPQTLSVVQAVIGAAAAGAPHRAEVRQAAISSLDAAVEGGTLSDACVVAHGALLVLVLSHDRGESDAEVHRAGWDALAAAADVARELKLHAAGHGLGVDAFPGTLHGAGPSVAELVLSARPSEQIVVFAVAGAPVGTLNRALASAFADPFASARLATAPALHTGFIFEVHDLVERRKAMFNAPADLSDLLACLAEDHRYALKRVVSVEGTVAAVASTDEAARVLGITGADDAPVAIARGGGDFPTVEELSAPHRLPGFVAGPGDGRLRPLLPATMPLEGAPAPSGSPRVLSLTFQLAGGRLLGPGDGFAAPAFEAARARAVDVSSWLDDLGPFAPRRPDESLDELLTEVGGGRWSDL